MRHALATSLPDVLRRQFRQLLLDRVTCTLLVVWLLVASVVVQVRIVDPLSSDLARQLGLLALLGIAAGSLLYLVTRDRPSAVRVEVVTAHQAAWPAAGAVAGIICAIVGVRLVGGDEWNGQWWWIAAMAIPLLAPLAERVRLWFLSGRSFPRFPRIDIALGSMLVVIALVVRLPAITDSPPFLLGDEASCGLYGRVFDAGHTPLLSISWYGLPMLSYAVSGVGLWVFGNDLSGLRLINAVIGSLAVLLLYLLGKEWFGRRAGALSAVLFAVWFLPVELSRDGIHYIQGPTCIILTLLLCTLWLQRGGTLYALLAGMSLILDVQVYWSARVAPLLAACLIGLVLLHDRRLIRKRTNELLWFVTGALVAGLPVLGLFRSVPDSFNGHQSYVSIFSHDPTVTTHLLSQYGHISTVGLLQQQIWKVITTFNARGDASVIFGQWGHALLDPISASLLVPAIVLALFRWRRWEYLICLAWIGMVVGAGIVTLDPPLWHRLLAVTPALALLLGVLLADLWRLLAEQTRNIWAVAIALLVVLGAVTFSNLQAAFVAYPDVARQQSMEATYVARFLAHAPGAADTVMLSDGSILVTYEPIRFLAPRSGGCTLFPGQPLSACPLARSSKLFVLLPGRVRDLAWLRRQRHGGRVVPVATMNDGTEHILAYELR